MKHLGQYAIGAGLGLTLFGLVWAADARSDGFDPDLIHNQEVICANLKGADDVSQIHDLFLIFGRDYVAGAARDMCADQGVKVRVALQTFKPAEDGPDWDCTTDGDRTCGPTNSNGVPAGCYDDGGVLVAPWPCHIIVNNDGSSDVYVT